MTVAWRHTVRKKVEFGMPIEIKELHIRVTVNTSQGGQAADGAPAAGKPGPAADESKDAIVAECVEQVLQIIQNRAER